MLVAFHGLFADGQELLRWDDGVNLIENDGYKGITRAHLEWMLKSAHLAVYEPLAWLVKAIEHAAFGLSARGFHLVTLALHVASAVVVCDLARHVVSRAWVNAKPAEVEASAVFSALLFGVHAGRTAMR